MMALDGDPHTRMDRNYFPVKVVQNQQLSPGYAKLLISPTSSTIGAEHWNTIIHAEPGQFFMVWLPNYYCNDHDAHRKKTQGADSIPLSIAGARDGNLALVVKSVGPTTESLVAMNPGDKLGIMGPLGTFFSLPENGKICIVGGGIGLAPLVFLAEKASERGLPVTAFLGFRTASEKILTEDLERSCHNVHVSTDDGTEGFHGRVTELLQSMLGSGEISGISNIYTCGPKPMMKAVMELCYEHDIQSEHCLEREMNCGLGICGSCSINGVLVCRNGPVFSGYTIRNNGLL